MNELKKHITQKKDVKQIFVKSLDDMIKYIDSANETEINYKKLPTCIKSYPLNVKFEKCNSNSIKVTLEVNDKTLTSTLDITEKSYSFRLVLNKAYIIDSSYVTISYLKECKKILETQIKELKHALTNFDIYVDKTNEIIKLIEKYKKEVPLSMRISIQYDKKVLF